eukprot:ANDGO_05711.mRNA.1 hypothetical protein
MSSSFRIEREVAGGDSSNQQLIWDVLCEPSYVPSRQPLVRKVCVSPSARGSVHQYDLEVTEHIFFGLVPIAIRSKLTVDSAAHKLLYETVSGPVTLHSDITLLVSDGSLKLVENVSFSAPYLTRWYVLSTAKHAHEEMMGSIQEDLRTRISKK